MSERGIHTWQKFGVWGLAFRIIVPRPCENFSIPVGPCYIGLNPRYGEKGGRTFWEFLKRTPVESFRGTPVMLLIVFMCLFPGLYWGYIGIMEKRMETTGIIGVI